MIDELEPDERALLEAGRDALGPGSATIARLHGRVTAAAATTTFAATAVKLAIVSAVAAVIGTAAYVHVTREAPAVEAARAVEHHAPAPPLVNVDADAPAVVAAQAAPTPAVVVPSRPPIRRVAHVERPPQPASLAREIELVDQAMTALRRRELASVLVTIHAYQTETLGHGQLAEDAAAIEVEALCRSGDHAATDRLAAFVHQFPHSAQRQRLAAACP